MQAILKFNCTNDLDDETEKLQACINGWKYMITLAQVRDCLKENNISEALCIINEVMPEFINDR